MPTADVTPTTTTTEAPGVDMPAVDANPDPTAVNEDQCPVCPHAWSGHDATGTRFCTATMTAALTRGCVCPRA